MGGWLTHIQPVKKKKIYKCRVERRRKRIVKVRVGGIEICEEGRGKRKISGRTKEAARYGVHFEWQRQSREKQRHTVMLLMRLTWFSWPGLL